MTDSSSADGVDIENPTRTAPIGSSTVDSDSTSVGNRTMKWGLVSAFLLVAVVVGISVGVTLRSGGGGAAPTTSISVAANNVIDNKVQLLDNPQSTIEGKSKARIIDPSVTRGYNSCTDLLEDLRNALRQYVNSVIDYEAEYNTMYEQCDPNDPVPLYDDDTTVVRDLLKSATNENAAGDDPIISGATSRSRSSKTEKENSYETKKQASQVPGVDEADYVKSDGEYVFAAYGEFLYAWNALDGPNVGVSITELPYDKVKICAFPVPEPTPVNDTSSNSSAVPKEPCDYYQPKLKTAALLVHEGRLTAIIVSQVFDSSFPENELPPKIMGDYTQLTIRVYDISNIQLDDSPLTLLAQSEKPIKGSYNVALSSKNIVTLAVTSSIDTYSLVGDLFRGNTQYCGLNSTEYTKLAVETASNRTETFAASMMEELQLQLVGTCESVVQIAALQSGESFMQVVNFDVSSEFIDEKVVYAGAAGSFISGEPYFYATQDFLAAITSASSFILGFDISGDTTAAPRPYCFAEVPGMASNLIDVYKGHLRILTTEYIWSENILSTKIAVSIIDVPPPASDAGTEMLLIGQISVELASPYDSVLFVRFMEDWGYVEMSTGQFFVFDLSDPSDPKNVGGLETSGNISSFESSFLEPIKIDGDPYMLEVGVFLNETSWEDNVKITVFDISDPTNLQTKATHIERNVTYIAGYDFKTSRYLEESHKLITPKHVYKVDENFMDTGMNFDGFLVYDVNGSDITPIYDIRHVLSEDVFNGCNNKADLPARSFLFESKLTTILSHSVISTDLETGEHLWTYNLENRSNSIDCEPLGTLS